MQRVINIFFENAPGIFLDFFLGALEPPKINIIGFEARGHVQKSRNHRNEGFEGFPRMTSKSYTFKLKQNHITELLSTSYPQDYHKNDPTNRNKCETCFVLSGLLVS